MPSTGQTAGHVQILDDGSGEIDWENLNYPQLKSWRA